MGELLPAVPTTPNNVTDSWQPLVDSNVMSSYGMNVVTLTEWSTSTVIPAIAQGSAIDIDGSTARFVTTEAIGGAPANGTVYVMFIVSGSTVTAELTATAPIWDNTKGGWYGGATGNRYSGHFMSKNGVSYSGKAKLSDDNGYATMHDGVPLIEGVTNDAGYFGLSDPPSQQVPINATGTYIVDNVMFNCSGQIDIKTSWTTIGLALSCSTQLINLSTGATAFSNVTSVPADTTINQTNTSVTVIAGMPYAFQVVATSSFVTTISVSWETSINKGGRIWRS